MRRARDLLCDPCNNKLVLCLSKLDAIEFVLLMTLSASFCLSSLPHDFGCFFLLEGSRSLGSMSPKDCNHLIIIAYSLDKVVFLAMHCPVKSQQFGRRPGICAHRNMRQPQYMEETSMTPTKVAFVQVGLYRRRCSS